MKQVVFRSGNAICVDVPAPKIQSEMILVNVHSSCISTGTEMTGLTASGISLLEKAKDNPEKLRSAFSRMKTEGILKVISRAKAKNESESLCGYSAAGVVRDIGSGVSGFSKGMRVAIAGAGYANHAEQAVVPLNLAVPIPEDVTIEEASTCALGGIALQGVRRADTRIGDYVVVLGCGAIGLLSVQMLRAAGCRVIGIDLENERLDLARELGAEFVFDASNADIVRKVIHATDGHGADRIILTLATSSSEPVRQAFEMSRRKGRIVLVGVAGLSLDRKAMYRKELDFVISTSYGPGRYDEKYERQGIDYPYAYVRWTENRNMRAYLNMISGGSVKLGRIIGGKYRVEDAGRAYESLKQRNRPLLLVLSYSSDDEEQNKDIGTVNTEWTLPSDSQLRVGLIGTGSFVQSMHIPNISNLQEYYLITSACDINGMTARRAANLISSHDVSIETDYIKLLQSDIDLVLIGTRHDSHATLAMEALKAGKAVFVEKPMCITRDEFSKLTQVVSDTDAPFMVGYNRRFAPAVQEIRKITNNRINPLIIHYTVNAGFIPYDSWVHTEEGGGRIVGEACHIFDLFRSMTGARALSVSIDGIRPNTGSIRSSDNVVVTIKYSDGSVCSLLYTSLGNRNAPKERMEVFCDEQVFIIDDYRQLTSYGTRCNWKAKKAEKGHFEELVYFHEQIANGNRFPIPLEQLEETWLISRQVADELSF